MKRSTRFIISLLLTLCLLAGIVPAQALAEEVLPPTPGVPENLTASTTYHSAALSWTAAEPADGYRVYRGRKLVGETQETAFKDTGLETGKTYTYTVKAFLQVESVDPEDPEAVPMVEIVEGESSEPVKAKTDLRAVTLRAISSSAYNRVKISWKRVGAATGYQILRKQKGTGWTVIFECEAPQLSWTDKSVDVGTTYTYSVRAVRGDYKKAPYDKTGLKIKPILDPASIQSAEPLDYNKVRVRWPKVKGATGYRIYRRKASTKAWRRIAQTGAKARSYTDTKAKTGVKYFYTVRALRTVGEKDVLSPFDTKGLSAKTHPKAPVIRSAAVSGKDVVVKWKKVAGASGYRVYRRTKDGEWKSIALLSKGTLKYKDTKAEFKTKYFYRVRAFRTVDGKRIYGAYSSNLSCKVPVPTPKLVSISLEERDVTVTWNRSAGAAGYRVMRKKKGGEWTNLVTLNGDHTSYTDTSTEAGVTYYYTVRAYGRKGDTNVWSGFEKGLKCAVVPRAPKLLRAMPSGSHHMDITWEPIDHAEGYLIYRKSGDDWTHIGTVDSGATGIFTDSSGTYGQTYTYTVKAYWKNGSKKTGGKCSETGVSAKLAYYARYVNGYKLYYDMKGNLIRDVDKIIGTQSSYIIKVNKQCNTVTIYARDGSGGYIVPVKACICSCGEPTPTGMFYTPEKYRWKVLIGPVYGQWSTRIYGGVLFHTVYYYTNENNKTLCITAFNKLGSLDSMGCTRLLCKDAKWIYDYCRLGTQVTIYNSSDPGPFGKPSVMRLPSWHTWDPTDPNCRYLCEAYNCH